MIVWLLAALAAVARPPADAQSIDGVPESHFLEQRERFTPQGGTPVDLRFLITPEASGQTTRLVDATHAAISLLSDWFGPLASSSLTVAAVPWRGGASIASRAEFAAVPVRWLTPVRDRSTERAVIAALVRQYWGSHTPTTFEAAVNIYIGTRAVHTILEGSNFAAPRFFGGIVPFPLRSVLLSPPIADPRPRFWGFEEIEPGALPADVDHAVRALQTFERYVGWPTMLEALSRVRVGPDPRDAPTFAAALSEARGTDMRTLVGQSFGEDGAFQYAIESMQSQAGPSGLIETTLSIKRLSDRQFTVTNESGDRENTMPLLVRFADGEEIRDYFDGALPSVTMIYSAKTAATAAWIDPDAMLILDRNRENNAIVRDAPTSRLGLRLALQWMAWLQNAMLSYTAIL